jgi:hypothetical protein
VISANKDVVSFLNEMPLPFTQECCAKKGDADLDENDQHIVQVLTSLSSMHDDGSEEEEVDMHVQCDSTSEDDTPSDESSTDNGDAPVNKCPKLRVVAIYNSRSFLQGLLRDPNNHYDTTDINDLIELPAVQDIADKAALDLHTYFPSCKNNSAGQTKFFKYFHEYNTTQYHQSISEQISSITPRKRKILVDMLFNIRQKVTDSAVELPEVTSNDTVEVEIAIENQSKMRYLMGRCVAKCKQNTQSYIIRHRGAHSTPSKSLEEARSKVEHLQHMRTSVDDIMNSAFKDTLIETERRQNLGRGLTHITNEAFLFCLELEKQRQQLHTMDRLATLTSSHKCLHIPHLLLT